MEKAPYGFVGLGGMGSEVVRNLLDQGVRPAVYNRTRSKTDALVSEGAIGCYSLEELAEKVVRPRLIWIMLTAGRPVDEAIFGGGAFGDGLAPFLEPGDTIVDGGNSYFRDSIRRYRALKEREVGFLDCGTSGGLEGSRRGPCLMVGGEEEVFERARPLFERLVRDSGGLALVGPPGAGHFVKMVHNAIEYGILQCIGEGFELLHIGPVDESGKPLFRLDLTQIAALWCRGSVIRGWLMELAARAFEKDPELNTITGFVGGGSTGRWSLDEGWDAGVPMATIAMSFALRLRSRQSDTFAGKVVAALRREFGGHSVVPTSADPPDEEGR